MVMIEFSCMTVFTTSLLSVTMRMIGRANAAPSVEGYELRAVASLHVSRDIRVGPIRPTAFSDSS